MYSFIYRKNPVEHSHMLIRLHVKVGFIPESWKLCQNFYLYLYYFDTKSKSFKALMFSFKIQQSNDEHLIEGKILLTLTCLINSIFLYITCLRPMLGFLRTSILNFL